MEINVTDESFDSEVLGSDLPVLVDFWAPWCGPCKMIAPVLSEIAEERAGKLKVCKANVQDHPALAARFRVMSIPALMLFKGGEVTARSVGAVPKADIEAMIDG